MLNFNKKCGMSTDSVSRLLNSTHLAREAISISSLSSSLHVRRLNCPFMHLPSPMQLAVDKFLNTNCSRTFAASSF